MELWTTQHAKVWLPTLFAEILIAAALGYLLRKKSLRIRCIPIAVITGIIWALEIVKQALSIAEGYDLYRLPVHFCSLFLYYYPFFVWFKMSEKEHNGFWAQLADIMGIVCGASLFMFMLVYPNMIYGAGNMLPGGLFFDFHTVAYHNLCTFAFLLMVALKLYNKPDTKRNMLFVAGGSAAYGIVTGTLANVLQTNYGNFYTCPIGPIEDMRLALNESVGLFGQAVYVGLYIIIMIGFTLGCYWMFRGLARARDACEKRFYAKAEKPSSATEADK